MKTIIVPIINETYTIEEPEDYPLPSDVDIDNLPILEEDIDDDYVGWTINGHYDIMHVKQGKELHKEDGPALYKTTSPKKVGWYKDSNLVKEIKKLKDGSIHIGYEKPNQFGAHRNPKEGPALIDFSNETNYSISYLVNGKQLSGDYHRSNGPAGIERYRNELYLKYYINGKFIKELKFNIK